MATGNPRRLARTSVSGASTTARAGEPRLDELAADRGIAAGELRLGSEREVPAGRRADARASRRGLELHGLPGHRELFEKLRDAVQDARQTNRPMELVGDEHGHALEMH